ncbi:hypothetical protein PMS04_05755, partial [Bifidobacterium longum]|nr:hypothetical protein [Bifidobacterium longum]
LPDLRQTRPQHRHHLTDPPTPNSERPKKLLRDIGVEGMTECFVLAPFCISGQGYWMWLRMGVGRMRIDWRI